MLGSGLTGASAASVASPLHAGLDAGGCRRSAGYAGDIESDSPGEIDCKFGLLGCCEWIVRVLAMCVADIAAKGGDASDHRLYVASHLPEAAICLCPRRELQDLKYCVEKLREIGRRREGETAVKEDVLADALEQ